MENLFPGAVDKSSRLQPENRTAAADQMAPHGIKSILILYNQQILRHLFRVGIVSQRFRRIIDIQHFHGYPHVPAHRLSLLFLKKFFPAPDLKAPLVHGLFRPKLFPAVLQIPVHHQHPGTLCLIDLRMRNVIIDSNRRR